MKKLFKWAVILSVALFATSFLSACSDDDNTEKQSLRVTPPSYEFNAATNLEKEFKVETDAADWKTEKQGTWFTIVEGTGKFTVTAVANTEDKVQEGTIIVRAGNADPVTVTLTQKAYSEQGETYTIELKPSRVNFEAADDKEETVEVETEAPSWTIVPDAENTWAAAVEEEGKIIVTVEENTEEGSRTAYIKVTGQDAKDATLEVYQKGTATVETTISLTEDEIYFEYDEVDVKKSTTVTVTGEGDQEWDFIIDAEDTWVKAEKVNGDLEVWVDNINDNAERTAVITITAEGAEEVMLTVTQRAASGEAELTFADIAGNYQGTLTFTFTDIDTGIPEAPKYDPVDVIIENDKLILPAFPLLNLVNAILGEGGEEFAQEIVDAVGDLRYEMTMTKENADGSTFTASIQTPRLDLDIAEVMTVVEVSIVSTEDLVFTAASDMITFRLQTDALLAITGGFEMFNGPFDYVDLNFELTRK